MIRFLHKTRQVLQTSLSTATGAAKRCKTIHMDSDNKDLIFLVRERMEGHDV